MSDGSPEDVLDPDETAVSPSQGGSRGEGSVTVVGTAHVSEESAERVERTVEDEQPDVVAVELDESRYRRLKGETPDDIDAGDLISGKTVYQFLAYWLLSYVQARMGDQFDIEPGADMMAAVDTAERVGCGVALVDRDIQETVRRLWSRMRRREKLSILAALLVEMGGPLVAGLTIGLFVGLFVAVVAGALAGSIFVPAGVGASIGIPLVGGLVGALSGIVDSLLVAGGTALVVGLPVGALLARSAGDVEYEEVDLERLTDADVVTAMMEEFRRFSPGGAEALIDERDAYIAYRLIALRDAGYDVVAVVGAGHREGIQGYLDAPTSLPPADSLVGEQSGSRLGSILYKGIGYTFALGFFAFFVLLAMAGVENLWLLQLFVAWFLVNGIIAASLALVAGAHWTSATVGGAVAWFTSVNPLLAPGWFAGYVELRHTKVNVADISTLNEMLSNEEIPLTTLFVRMRNEVPTFRLIMVVALTNVGSFVASVLFATILLPYFTADAGGVTWLGEQMVEGASNSARLIWETVT